MKKLMYLLVAGAMFVFTACNSGADAGTEEAVVEEVVACVKVCQKACCLGCKAEGGTCLADHSCCIVKEDSHADHE